MGNWSIKKQINSFRGKERKTKTDGHYRELYNSLFTEIQYIGGRLENWVFKKSKDGPEATTVDKMNLLLMYHQIEQQRKHTRWFIILVIATIISVVLNVILN